MTAGAAPAGTVPTTVPVAPGPGTTPVVGAPGAGETTGLAFEDQRAGRRLDANRPVTVGDEGSDPSSGQRGLGTLSDQVELAQPNEPAERAAVPLRRTDGTGEREHPSKRESGSGQRDDHAEGQR